jgi:HNH endonuclease
MLNETNIKEYLLSNITKKDGPIEGSQCWIFTGPHISQGYGRVYYGGRMEGVHRLAYIAWVGPLLPWTAVHHACNQRCCLNPDHLQSQRPGRKVRRN